MKRLATQKTIIPTETGNIIYEPGDIMETKEELGLEIEKTYKHTSKVMHDTAAWKAGRPVKVTIAGVTRLVSNARTGLSWGDMDSVLPKEIRNKRQKIIKERMKQERV